MDGTITVAIIGLIGTIVAAVIIARYRHTDSSQNMKNTEQGMQTIARDINDSVFINVTVPPKVLNDISKEKEIRTISEVNPKDFDEIKEINEETINYKEQKELLNKIYIHLEKSQAIGTIAEMSLRLCQNLKMDAYLECLKKEVYGYKAGKDNKPLEHRKIGGTKEPSYRTINAELLIAFKRDNSKIQKLDLNLFISAPISIIENWINSAGNSNQLALHDAPPKIIVDKLRINTNEKVPYVIQTSSLRILLVGFRLDLNRFLEQAKKEIDKYV